MSSRNASRTFVLRGTFASESFPDQRLFTVDRGTFCQRAAGFLEALGSGHEEGTLSVVVDGGDSVRASGTVTLATSSGTISAVINGVTTSVTWATSDTATAAALAAAINGSANALVDLHVTATSALGVVTVTAVAEGAAGNAVTFTASGTNVTASGSGRLTGGVNATLNTQSF